MTKIMSGKTVQENITAETDLSSEEIKQRVAILKRFRELLSQQRDRFRHYLQALDKQKNVIEAGSAEDLLVHVELEENIVADIFSIQKVIDPLEAMYQDRCLGSSAAIDEEVPSLRKALEELRSEAIIRSTRNRDLLSRRMTELRQEIKTLRSNPYIIHRSLFSQESPVLVDIKG